MAISRASDVDPKKEATVHRHKTETGEADGKKWVPTYEIQQGSRSITSAEMEERAVEIWETMGHSKGEIQSMAFYIKPAENRVYSVINGISYNFFLFP